AGFLDSAVSGKRIQMGTMIPVYQVREAQLKKLRAAGITVILVPDCDVDEGEMLQLVDLSMKVDMEIRRVPSVRSWVSAKARYHADPAPEDLLGREPVCIQTPNCHAEEITGRV